jgi:hypothetical protein
MQYIVNKYVLNSLNTELNPICHLLALLEAHHILHVSRIRIKGTVIKWHGSRISPIHDINRNIQHLHSDNFTPVR